MRRIPLAMLSIASLIPGLPLWAESPADSTIILSTTFDAGRVYVRMLLSKSDGSLVFFTDTGGGLILSKEAIKRLGAEPRAVSDPNAIAELGAEAQVVDARDFNSRVKGVKLPEDEFFVVTADVRQVPDWPTQGDGILGQAWFGGNVWTWDYPGRKLILRPADWKPNADAQPLNVRFKVDSQGKRVTNFPEIDIRVEGQLIPMLLDTGAETLLTPKALSALADAGPAFRATSMIAKSLFDRWRSEHRNWRVIEDAQVTTHAAMIEVPHVMLATLDMGPVWFTERPDANFHEFMSAMTATRVEGSLGGNALQKVILTLDYPHSRAWISRESPR